MKRRAVVAAVCVTLVLFDFSAVSVQADSLGEVMAAEEKNLTSENMPSEEIQTVIEEETEEPSLAESSETVISETEVIINLAEGSTESELRRALSVEHEGKHLTVNVPSGEYYLTRYLTFRSDLTLHSEPDTRYIVDCSYGIVFSACDFNGETDRGGYDNIQNVTVDGGIFDANGHGVELMQFMHGRNITVKNAVFQNPKDGSHLLTLEGVDGAVVSGCSFRDYQYQSATPKRKEALHIDIVHNSDMAPGTNLYDDAYCKNILITDCTFSHVPRAVGSHSAVRGIFPRNIRIENNRFTDICYEAVKLFNYRDTVIADNTIENCGYGILVHTKIDEDNYHAAIYDTKKDNSLFIPEPYPNANDSYSYNIRIQGNTIRNINVKTAGNACAIAAIGHTKYPLGGVKIIDNTAENIKTAGVLLNTSCYGSLIRGNTVKNSRQGIYLADTTGSVLQKNIIRNPEKNAIYVQQSRKVTLDGNRIQNVKGASPIYVTDCTGAVTKNNHFSEFNKSPIWFDKTKNTNTGNFGLMVISTAGIGSTRITGMTAKEGSRVSVEVAGKTYAASVSGKQFTVSGIPRLIKNSRVSATETDHEGNRQTISVKVTQTNRTLEAPVLTKVQSQGCHALKITWKGVSGASGYRLYYAKGSSQRWTYITQLEKKTRSYVHKGLKAGVSYTYYIKACAPTGGKMKDSGYSQGVSGKPVLRATSITKLTGIKGGVSVRWSRPAEVSGYQVEYRVGQSGSWERAAQIGKSTTLSYTQKGLVKGTTVFCRVRAYRVEKGKKIYAPVSGIKHVTVK